MSYEIINARVQQKTDTEANWLSNPLIILPGEQAFVVDAAGKGVNFKIGDGTKTFAELDYWITYYVGVISQKVLSYLAQSANLSISGYFRNNSDLQKIIFINNSGGAIDLAIGTTDGGAEIGAITLPNGITELSVKYFFTDAQTVYFTGLTGKDFSLFVLYCQLDEVPAVAPGGGGGSTSSDPRYGTLYPFFPMYSGHEAVVWDFVTGLGKAGTGYESCMLVDGFDETYLIGYKSGDTIGGAVGANTITIAKTNLPSIQDKIYGQEGGKPGFGGGRQGIWVTNDGGSPKNNVGDVPYLLQQLGGASAPITIKPKSKIVLWYTGLPTTT